jgi:uncharacterized protein (UPF0332 family)
MSPIGDPETAWRKARAMLQEGQSLTPSRTPGAAVHCAYYAMHHAARAVLMRANGEAPVRHDKVIQAFGFLAKERGDQNLMAVGHDLNVVQERRLVSDYEGSMPPAGLAETALTNAHRLLSVCADRFGFDPP